MYFKNMPVSVFCAYMYKLVFYKWLFQSIHLHIQIHCLGVSPFCFHQISVNEQDEWLVFHSKFEHYPYQAY